MQTIKSFFLSNNSFTSTEWLLKHQIYALLIISFFFALGLLPFSFVRMQEGNIIVGVSQLLLSIFLLHGFFKLKSNKTYYQTYSILYMGFFFLYSAIIFFYVPQNKLNILWVISAPILIFFFLNKRGGMVMFIWVFLFIMYLILSRYHYSIAEFTTLISAFLITTFVMYVYEHVKDAEQERLMVYNDNLQNEVLEKTNILIELNEKLEVRVKEEVIHRLTQEEMLLRQNRMACMGEMIDSIAHQWRQPLMNINAVMMNLDRGIETHQEPHLLKGKVLEIFSLTTHMSHTIEDFRNLLKMEKEKENFLVEDVLVDILTLMKNNLKGITITRTFKNTNHTTGYKSELSQAFIIVLSNAIEALKSNNIADKQIQISTKLEDNVITIDIEDNAGGIDENNITRVFDPYFSTKEQEGGTGLGLYVAKIIVEQNMKGTIACENTMNGARFSMRLPLL